MGLINNMGKIIDFDINIRDFKFSDEVLIRGSNKPTEGLVPIQFKHSINILSYDLINVRERKIKFQFRMIMRPDIGEINFDGECILESPDQAKIHAMFKILRSFINRFILKYLYYHAEEFMKQENYPFPPAQAILRGFNIY